MTKRVEILVSFRGDPNETGHAETYFREGQYHDVPDSFAALVIGKGLAAAVEGVMATAPANIAALASPALQPLVDAVIGAAPPVPPPAPPFSNEGDSK